MNAMEFTLQALQSAPHIDVNRERTASKADRIKAKIVRHIKACPSTAEEIASAVGLSVASVKSYLRALMLDGVVEISSRIAANRPATYRVPA